jgi:tetratricopeptide (TPR) repeat protein
MRQARQIFLSHVEEDFSVTEEIVHAAEAAGYSTWYYERDYVPGEPFLITIGKAIQECRAVVLILSKESLDHGHQITPEVFQAFEGHKRFFPLLLDVAFDEFKSRQPEWHVAISGAVAIRVPAAGVSAIMPKLLDGLTAAGIPPEQARTLPPDELEAGLVQARRLLNDAGQLGVAGAEISGLVERFPGSSQAYRLLGEYYNRSFLHADAIDAFEKAVELSPTNALLHWDLALAYRQERRNRDAFDSLQRALELGLDPSRQRHAMTLLSQLRAGESG